MTLPLKGVVPPVVTPLNDDGSFDAASAERLYESLLADGVHGLFLFGSSGEGPLLPGDVRDAALATAQRIVNGRVPILAGCLEAGTDGVVDSARRFAERGVDALVVSPPFYFPGTQLEVVRHFEVVRAAVDVPVIAYDIPVTTKIKIETRTLLELAHREIVQGVKDSSGDMVGFRRLLVHRPEGFVVFTGTELVFDAALLTGADGIVPGLANVAAEPFVTLWQHWQAGRIAEAVAEQDRITRLFEVFVDPAIGVPRAGYALPAMKAGLALRGIIADDRMLDPMAAPGEKHTARIARIMTECGVLEGDGR